MVEKRKRGGPVSTGGKRGSGGRSRLTKAATPPPRRSTRLTAGVSARSLPVSEGGEAEFDDLPDPTKIVSRWESVFVVL